MKLRFSREGSKKEPGSTAKRSFFSKAKRHVLTAALAAGMAFAPVGPVKAGMNVPMKRSSQSAPLPVYDMRAYIWLVKNKQYFHFPMSDKGKAAEVAAFITKHMRSGLWYIQNRVSTTHWPFHPRCPPNISNGDCWAVGFKDSWFAKQGVPLNTNYCSSADGQADMRCKNGSPRNEPPGYCYGITDFKEFVDKCEKPFLPKMP